MPVITRNILLIIGGKKDEDNNQKRCGKKLYEKV